MISANDNGTIFIPLEVLTCLVKSDAYAKTPIILSIPPPKLTLKYLRTISPAAFLSCSLLSKLIWFHFSLSLLLNL